MRVLIVAVGAGLMDVQGSPDPCAADMSVIPPNRIWSNFTKIDELI
jgi:hypothetical protein